MVRLLIISLFCISVCYGQGNRFAGFGYKNTCPAEALLFIDSAGITNQTEKDAICTLVKQLKDSALWTKMYAVYPLLGNASSAKFNLKSPYSRDTSYCLTFYGGLTFSNGMVGNGTNGYANTHYNPSTTNYADFSFGLYLGLNKDEVVADMGTITAASPTRGYYIQARTSNVFYADAGEPSGGLATTNTDSRGFYCVYRTSTTFAKTLKDGSLLVTSAGTSAAYTGTNILIGCRDNFGTPAYFGSNNTGFAFLGKGLTDVEAVALNSIFQAFKTTLGR